MATLAKQTVVEIAAKSRREGLLTVLKAVNTQCSSVHYSLTALIRRHQSCAKQCRWDHILKFKDGSVLHVETDRPIPGSTCLEDEERQLD